MSQIMISEEQRTLVNGLENAQEVRDPSGQLVGYLISPARYARMLEAWEKWEEADIAELDRIAREDPVGTLQEIWKELGVE
jgi:hypothetical protein